MSQAYGPARPQADSLTGCHLGHDVEAPSQASELSCSFQMPSAGESQGVEPVAKPHPSRLAASPFAVPTASLIQKLA